MGILGWLFGKKPKITFTLNGRIQHDFPEKKWSDWNNRFKQNPVYNWKHHSGTQGVPKFTKK
jgi:hypothetical protein